MAATRLAEARFHSSIKGFHVYQNKWVPVQVSILSGSCEVENANDPYAVKLTSTEMIVGHLSKEISSMCLFIIS